MPAFRFVAVNRAGQIVQGQMDGPDEAHVIASLQRDGNIPMRAEPANRRSFFAGLLNVDLRRGGLGGQAVMNFTRELAIMLGAGQDLDQSLHFLASNARQPRLGKSLGQLRDAVRDGESLAAALAAQPKSFSRLYVGLVRAGEAGGALAATLERLSMLLERQRRLTATVWSAMIYPGLMGLVAVASVTLLLTKVLPQFVPLFVQNGAPMPESLRFLLHSGSFVGRDGPFLLAMLAGLLLFGRQWLRMPRPRLAADRLLLRLPGVGALLRDVLAARFTRTLGSLLSNGVALIPALGIVRDAIGNRAAVEAIEQATASAKGGGGLARPLAKAGIFPQQTTHLLQLGEGTGQLGPIALRIADIQDEKVQLAVQRLVSLLVPVITIVMGAIIGGIVSTLMLAMLSLNNLAG